MMQTGSLLDVVSQGMEDNIYNFTKNGKCSGCGNCCTDLLPMSEKEIRQVHRYIEKNHILECLHRAPVVKTAIDLTCPFRDNDNHKCVIYPVRPMICRSFICDSEKRAKINRALYHQTRGIIDVRGEFFGKPLNFELESVKQ